MCWMIDNADVYAEEGLKINGTDMSQIPTFVTGVPDGTEKVRELVSWKCRSTNMFRVYTSLLTSVEQTSECAPFSF
jgi:hypothetical protein